MTEEDKTIRTIKGLGGLLDEWQVQEYGMWDNEEGPKGWFSVSNNEGIVAYFSDMGDAFRYRLDKVNRILNP